MIFMCFCEFFKFNLNDLITGLVSMFTLILAYKIYRNFDVKKTHLNKQLETVLSLVQEINKTRICVSFWTKIPSEILARHPEYGKVSKSTLEAWEYSIFNIAMLDEKKTQFENIFLSTNVSKILPYISFVNNPLLPKEIAEQLSEFYSAWMNYPKFEELSNRYVSLSPIFEENNSSMQIPFNNSTYSSWTNFIKASKQLKRIIERWLKKYGSEDININTYMFGIDIDDKSKAPNKES